MGTIKTRARARAIDEVRKAMANYKPESIEEFARGQFGRGHYDFQEEMGADMARIFQEDAIGGILTAYHMGVIENIPQTDEEFRNFYKNVAFPAIRKTHDRTVGWFIEQMMVNNPDLYEELLERGADLNLTEYIQTLGSVVTCNFYLMEGIMLAQVDWDVSTNTYNVYWIWD